MVILETALDIERLSIAFYRQLEKQVDMESVRAAARMLAGEEVAHAAMIRRIIEDSDETGYEDGAPETTDMLAGVVKEFEKELRAVGSLNGSLVILFARGLELELKTIELYEMIREAIPEHQETLERLLEEEGRHREMLDAFLDLARKAEEWVENPEFSHIGEEY